MTGRHTLAIDAGAGLPAPPTGEINAVTLPDTSHTLGLASRAGHARSRARRVAGLRPILLARNIAALFRCSDPLLCP
jgi:hypothetical protein